MTWDEIAAQATVGLLVVRDGEVQRCNPAAARLVEAHGGSWAEAGGLLRTVSPGSRRGIVRWPSPTGGTRWWEVTCSRLAGAELLYEILDETDRYSEDSHALGPLTAEWRLARLEAMTGSCSWVWSADDGLLVHSDGAVPLLGLPPGATLDSATIRDLLHPDDLPMVDAAMVRSLRTLEPLAFTHRMRTLEGRGERIWECVGEVFTDAQGVPHRMLGTSRDVTEAHRAREELAYLAEHDPLTGIANRRRITGRLAECATHPGGAALLLIDIDNFKDINDLRGHAVGDRVIREIARTVQTRLTAQTLLGRLGGDEFAVIVPEADAPDALELAEDLCDVVSRTPVVDRADAIAVTISVGVALVGADVDVETGLAQADLALYEAKRVGRNRARLFMPGHYDEAVRRVSVLQRVGAALDSGAMRLVAQPIVDLATGRTERHEVLIRLCDGRTPLLRPDEFLPAAERTDLVLRVDRWVLTRAIEALAAPRARAERLCLEVNVSARSLDDPELGRWILDQLKVAEVEPSRLGLEITETAAISNLDAARGLATPLAEAGCGFALDDFGAGFASFSHLKHLPFTAVKIAGEFVRQADHDPVDRALITAVVGVARQLGMRTVAEHVDRSPMVAHLRTLGVDDGQGFLLGRPRPLSELL